MMKIWALFFFFLLGHLSLSAQANNMTDDTWRINYYGAITVVPANDTEAINIGTDCAQGVSVSLVGSFCSHTFSSPSLWVVGCAPNTGSVEFMATASGYGCEANPVTYTDPEFTFSP